MSYSPRSSISTEEKEVFTSARKEINTWTRVLEAMEINDAYLLDEWVLGRLSHEWVLRQLLDEWVLGQLV